MVPRTVRICLGLAALGFVGLPAHAGVNVDTVYPSQAAVSCATDADCAAIANLRVKVVTDTAGTITITYAWAPSTTCSGLTAAQCFVPAGSHTGAFKWAPPLVDAAHAFLSTGGTVQCVQANATTGKLELTGTFCGDGGPYVAHLNVAQSFTQAQRGVPATLSLSGSTATPDFNAAQNFTLTLVHASCPCTIANPSTTLVAGQTGVIEVIQSGTGSDTLAWGTQFIAAGGTSAVVLSTAAGARDYVSYYVADSTHIVISAGALNATH